MKRPTIAIVDYQAGNLRSVQKVLESCGATTLITNQASIIEQADGLVFPGQGAIDSAMHSLRSADLITPIKSYIASGRAFLGVCLGLQLLLNGSDEGIEPGLGIVEGRVRRLPPGLKVPHMGWNQVKFYAPSPLFDGVADGSYFYFVHSFYADPSDQSVIAGRTSYGIEFCSAIAHQNMAAVQFHPEKSGDNGLRIYRNFVYLAGRG